MFVGLNTLNCRRRRGGSSNEATGATCGNKYLVLSVCLFLARRVEKRFGTGTEGETGPPRILVRSSKERCFGGAMFRERSSSENGSIFVGVAVGTNLKRGSFVEQGAEDKLARKPLLERKYRDFRNRVPMKVQWHE